MNYINTIYIFNSTKEILSQTIRNQNTLLVITYMTLEVQEHYLRKLSTIYNQF